MNIETQLTLRHVRTFLEIARGESVSSAAQRLHVTQPAVSRCLKELEALLGISLFDRVGRRLRLNEAGRIFQSHASASLTELLRGADRLAAGHELTSRLSIGVLPTAATDLVPRAALVFRSEMPHVRLRIQSGPNWLLFNQLRDGEVDLVVGRMPEKDFSVGLSFEQLYLEYVMLVCRPGHPILSHQNPEKHIADYTLILPPSGAVISRTVERYLSSIGLPEIRAAFETVALPVGRKLVSSSDALWFISRGVVLDELQAGVLQIVPLTSPLLSGSVGFCTATNAPLNVERNVFSDCLRTAARHRNSNLDTNDTTLSPT